MRNMMRSSLRDRNQIGLHSNARNVPIQNGVYTGCGDREVLVAQRR